MDERERQFQELVAYAGEDPDVIGLYVFGSRAREDELRDEQSDYDVAVVLRDGDSVVEAFDRRWPFVHGADVEISRSTLAELRGFGEYGTPSEWSRYLYTRVNIVLDKTGEIARILAAKESVPNEVRDRLIRDGIDGFVNSVYRSLRYRMVGAAEGARLDAAASIPYLLTALFAMDARVRPFNKYLEMELRHQPLSDPAWAADQLLPRLMSALDGDAGALHALFRDVERVARSRGFGEVVDGWEPHVAWLRGEADWSARMRAEYDRPMEADAPTVWAAVNEIYAGFLAGDRARIDRHIDPEATIWDSAEPGLVRGRAELDALRDRRPPGAPPETIEATDPVIDVWGDTALVRHLITVGPVRVRNTSVWRRRNGEWLCVHNHEDVLA